MLPSEHSAVFAKNQVAVLHLIRGKGPLSTDERRFVLRIYFALQEHPEYIGRDRDEKSHIVYITGRSLTSVII